MGWNPDNEELNRATEVIWLRRVRHGHRHLARTSSRSSSRPSSRRTAAPAASTAARAWAWPSAANCRGLLGGEIRLASTPGRGSTFNLLSAGALRPVATAAKRCVAHSIAPVPMLPTRGWNRSRPRRSRRGARRDATATSNGQSLNGHRRPARSLRRNRKSTRGWSTSTATTATTFSRTTACSSSWKTIRASPASCSIRPARRVSRAW